MVAVVAANGYAAYSISVAGESRTVITRAGDSFSQSTMSGPNPHPSLRNPNNYIENGREYHGWHRVKYMFPCDETEMDRHDIYHKFFSIARKGLLHSPRIKVSSPEQNYRIMDVGTGTGIWIIDMVDHYHTFVDKAYGIDLSPIQPHQIPPHLTFMHKDIEDPWDSYGENEWDMVHIRMLNGSVENWADIYGKVFRHLKPGSGWLEHVEIDMWPRCDDHTLPPGSFIERWTRELYLATELNHRPLAFNTNTIAQLEAQGFVDIKEEIIRIPLNSWPGPSDEHQREIGRWYNLGLTQGLDALSLQPLTKYRGWRREDIDRLVHEVRKEICSKKLHVYHVMHIFTARRP